ncbi:hypothetical protein [Thioalkalivibrio sulfidiphilus]|uniref:Uncharacterized protein n=1 Tax=Thioalkalivibrio sulfidiphilus (strain HL-EbGR7) TaxID=396588 RepID=B8GPD1_THISH|nr:hypothetical protein [Thioalkalivibrio sulfidiphilus]ACL74051.1 hypothetical protein Tgr7_2981 [Thioalkalivibrio sulfidiphilus HL-EbGr7]
MGQSQRKELIAMIGLPILTLTLYLLWIWPSPRSTSFFVELTPYLICLLTGFPFALAIGRAVHHPIFISLLYLVIGLVATYSYAIAFLCAVRDICL